MREKKVNRNETLDAPCPALVNPILLVDVLIDEAFQRVMIIHLVVWMVPTYTWKKRKILFNLSKNSYFTYF
jgi:hypothetical protein